jgi:hypothetical protein
MLSEADIPDTSSLREYEWSSNSGKRLYGQKVKRVRRATRQASAT